MLVVATSGVFLSLSTECAKLIRIAWERSHKAEQSARYEQGYRTNALGYAAEAERLANEARLAREAERLADPPGEGAPAAPRRRYDFNPIDHFNRNAPDLERASGAYRSAASRSIQMAEYYAILKQKYLKTSRVPWRSSTPDPPPP